MESVKLRELFPDYQGKDVVITGVQDHSQLVQAGDLFIATKDGTFIQEAIQRGAAAILVDRIYSQVSIPQVIDPQPSSIAWDVARRFYRDPFQKLSVIGVTGTNGKTTTAYLIRHLLNHMGLHTGLVGTVAWITGQKSYPSMRTTPSSVTLHRLAAEMVAEGARALVMEVSSHALDQNRTEGIPFTTGVFTNLSQDHLDYHGTMERYAQAKARLFHALPESGGAVLNHSDPASRLMRQGCKGKPLFYGRSSDADLYATCLRITAHQSMEFTVHFQGSVAPVHTPLLGWFNVDNILAAIGVLLTRGMDLHRIAQGVATFSTVPGRLEKVIHHRGYDVIVDYAHTPDALENILTTLRQFYRGNIITVFGCGGNRDSGKRPLMGAVVERLSDTTIITHDNPRHEDPQQIVCQILQGCRHPERVIVEADREWAIRHAIRLAQAGDVVCIAGKGHETTQVIGDTPFPFDDREVVRRACEE